MEIEFEKEYLQDLYEEGKTKKKKYRFQPQVIKGYKKAIDIMKNVNRIEDLFLFDNLNYEKLSGTDIESVRANNQYRIEFRSRIEEGIKSITICSIIELSNHYK